VRPERQDPAPGDPEDRRHEGVRSGGQHQPIVGQPAAVPELDLRFLAVYEGRLALDELHPLLFEPALGLQIQVRLLDLPGQQACQVEPVVGSTGLLGEDRDRRLGGHAPGMLRRGDARDPGAEDQHVGALLDGCGPAGVGLLLRDRLERLGAGAADRADLGQTVALVDVVADGAAPAGSCRRGGGRRDLERREHVRSHTADRTDLGRAVALVDVPADLALPGFRHHVPTR
jgi:hypothetical protein